MPNALEELHARITSAVDKYLTPALLKVQRNLLHRSLNLLQNFEIYHMKLEIYYTRTKFTTPKYADCAGGGAQKDRLR